MGVRGLLKFVRHCSSLKRETLVLSTETKRKYGADKVILVCDFIAIAYWLLDDLYKAKKEKYSALYGGDLNEYRERLLGLVEALRRLDIEPVFFCDGPRGSGGSYEMKLATWEKRTVETLAVIAEHALICKYDRKTEVQFKKQIKRSLLSDELQRGLMNAGVEVIICQGEADDVMAQYMREHSDKVCAILSNDTDLMLMADCSAIHYKFFDCRNALKLSTVQMECRPNEIHCEVVKPDDLARIFKFNKRCLPALSILCGNDFTSGLNEELDIKRILGFGRYQTVESVAVWVKSHERDCMSATSFLAIREIDKICKKDPRYIGAVRHSYSFYTRRSTPAAASAIAHVSDVDDSEVSSTSSDDNDSDTVDIIFHGDTDDDDSSTEADAAAWSPLYDYVVSEVVAHKLNRKWLPAVRSGIMWRDEIEQLDDERLPCIHDKLLPVRTAVYQLLCCHPSVTEYGQQGVNGYVVRKIDVKPCDQTLLRRIRAELSNEQKIAILLNIFKMEAVTLPEDPATLLSVGVPKVALEMTPSLLACTCIMFSLRNHLIPEEYITPLLLACFYCSLGNTPPKIAARPGPTGVTIASQFMVVHHHIRLFASLLGLEEILPLPSTVFQPYVYIPLHGTAFKLAERQKFRGPDIHAEQMYNRFAEDKVFKDFRRCICDKHAVDHIKTVVDMFLTTKDAIEQLSVKAGPVPKIKEKKRSSST